MIASFSFCNVTDIEILFFVVDSVKVENCILVMTSVYINMAPRLDSPIGCGLMAAVFMLRLIHYFQCNGIGGGKYLRIKCIFFMIFVDNKWKLEIPGTYQKFKTRLVLFTIHFVTVVGWRKRV